MGREMSRPCRPVAVPAPYRFMDFNNGLRGVRVVEMELYVNLQMPFKCRIARVLKRRRCVCCDGGRYSNLGVHEAISVVLSRNHRNQASVHRPLPQDSGAKASSQSLPSPRRGMGEPTERRLPTTPQGWPRSADRSKTSGWLQGRPSGPVEVGGRLPPRPQAACCGARLSQEGRPPTERDLPRRQRGTPRAAGPLETRSVERAQGGVDPGRPALGARAFHDSGTA